MKLSVIIPTFNCARFVSRAINSVLEQKWHDLEIIVVDDGSIDDTAQVVQKFVDSTLRYIRQSNLGPAAARNRGIRESQAEWIAFLDADDYWLPGKLKAQMNILEGNNGRAVDFVYCDTLLVDSTDRIIVQRPALKEHSLLDSLIWGNIASTSSVIARKSSLLAVGLFDESLRLGEDWDLWLRLALDFHGVCAAEPLVAVRLSEWDTKYDMKLYETTVMRVLEKFSALLQHREDLGSLRSQMRKVFSWHWSVIAKSYLYRSDLRNFARCAARCLNTSPKGVCYLILGTKQ